MSTNIADNQSTRFYEKISAFADFSEFTENRHYTTAPDNWFIFVADIRGSTKAIEAGKYRDINMIGAACIAGVVNAVKPFDIPYVFGGDGATLVAPEFLKEKIIDALRSVQKRAYEKFGFELRVGCVSVKTVKSYSVHVEIAKHHMADKVDLAMFRGGGLAKAEELIKNNSPEAEMILPKDFTGDPELDGLSCRWSAFKATRGCVLSIIVKAKSASNDVNQIYLQVMQQIETILKSSLDQRNPVSIQKLQKLAFTFQGIATEWQATSSKHEKWKKIISTILAALTSKMIIRFNIYFGPFVAKKYKEELIPRCDYKKFDDTLRLVLDCSENEKQQIQSYLEKLHQEHKIDFGIHSSDTALMTCYVPNASNGTHIHFIDGNNGGYALAAKQMKSRSKIMPQGAV